jgi:hypothetical protein
MRHHFIWLIALTITIASISRSAAGIVVISTRKNICADQGADNIDAKGPGMTTPGDVAIGNLLGNYGYSSRLILDVLLGAEPTTYLEPADTNLNIGLLICSGSSGSTDVPAPPPGIPVMMGEHVTLGNRTDRPGSIFMYNGSASNDPNESSTPAATKYMKVIAPDHPIMAGIPLDSQGRVKIFREPYPDEELHVPTGGKKNFEYRWCTQTAADKASGTIILGVLDGAEDRACLAVADKGGMLANSQAAGARLVHIFMNENGSGGSRRVFLALTDVGRLIFVRAAQWAMGEELPRHRSIRITEIKPVAAQNVKLSWESSARQNYQIQASTDLNDWQTVVDDLIGADGTLSRNLQIAEMPQAVFLRLRATP